MQAILYINTILSSDCIAKPTKLMGGQMCICSYSSESICFLTTLLTNNPGRELQELKAYVFYIHQI